MIKKSIFLMILLMGMTSCRSSKKDGVSNQAFHYLDSLRSHHQYFTFRDSFQQKKELLAEDQKMMLEAQLLSIFNRREAFNDLLDQVFRNHETTLFDL